jgi:hypothetical protein
MAFSPSEGGFNRADLWININQKIDGSASQLTSFEVLKLFNELTI